MNAEKKQGQPAKERVTPFTDEELEHFRQIILKKRASAVEEIARMRDRLSDGNSDSDDSSPYGLHMADAGTNEMEKEKLYLMIARQQKFIGYLDRALERIKNKTYGICKVTGKPIAKERLESVPHTEISIAAKREQRGG